MILNFICFHIHIKDILILFILFYFITHKMFPFGILEALLAYDHNFSRQRKLYLMEMLMIKAEETK